MSVLAEKFIKFSQFLDDVKFGYAFNSHEWSVLLVVTSAKFDGNFLKVKDLLAMDQIASPATIHKCIKSLVSREFICIVHDENDARIKYLNPNKKALNLLQEVGKKMC